MMKKIYSVGISSDGPFIDFQGEPSAVVVSPTTGSIQIVTSIEAGLFQGAFPGKNVLAFELTPATKVDSGWRISILVELTNGLKKTLPIGVWSKDYRHIQSWVGQVNQLYEDLRKPVLPSISGIICATAARVAETKVLLGRYGFSLSSARRKIGTNYKKRWMDYTASNISTIVANRYGLEKSPAISIGSWESDEPWDIVFDRLILDPSRQSHSHHRLDICFEVLYMTNERRAKFGLVEIGKLKAGTLLFHPDNAVIRGVAARNFHAKKNYIFDFDDFFREVSSLNEDGEVKNQSVITSLGTVSTYSCRELASRGFWNSQNHIIISDNSDLISQLYLNRESQFLFCDTVIANDFYARWNKPGKLIGMSILYPEPVPVGFAYDARDPEWGGILREVIESVVTSENDVVKSSWRETLRDLQEISVELSEWVDFGRIASTQGII